MEARSGSVLHETRRFCHASGLGDISSFEGKIATCGNDCDLRILSITDDSYYKEFGIESDYSHCLATWNCSEGLLIAVAMDDFSVKIFTEAGSFYTLLFRFNGSVNHMDISKKKRYLVAGSSDFLIKIATLEDMSQCGIFSGHDAPILSVKVSPDEKNLASVSCDGTVRMWSIESKSCLKKYNCFPRSNDISIDRFLGRMAWEQHCNDILIVPCGHTGIKCFTCNTWQERDDWLPLDKGKCYSTACWSPCGSFLASGTCDGDVIVWDVAKKAVSQRVHVAPNWAICAIEFVGETIITLDTEGYISWIPNVPASVVLQDEEMMQTADEPIYEDNVDFEEESRTKRFCPNDDNDSVSDVVYESASNRISMETSKDILAFQSSEAPRDLANRFMAYNLVGLVRSHQNNVSGVSSVEVEFHDASLHHSLTIPNQFDYEMASLTESALCLACTSGNGHGSQLYCICFQEQDAGREWTLPMPKKEEIKAIAQGDDWIAVATSHHFLRIISLGGIQQQLFSIPGPVITLAAHGEKLAIVFQGDTCNRYRLCIAETSSYVPKINVVDLPLSPGSTLKWMGYSPSGVLSTYDSIGILRVAVSSSMTWIPALDTKSDLSSKHDTYFGVGLSESPEEFRCILCKGTPYPPVQPRPVMISVPLKIPVCEVATERGQLEEEFIRSVSLAPSEHTMLAKTLTKMFAMSCKCGRKRRALDVARLFPNWQMLELPMTYCRKNQLHALCDKISQLIDKKKGNEGLRVTFSDDEDDDDDDDDVDNGISAIKKGSSQKIADLPISADKGTSGEKPTLHASFTSQLKGEDKKSAKVIPSKNKFAQECTNPFKIADTLKSTRQEESHSSSGLFHAMAVTTGKKKPALAGAETELKESQQKVQQKLKTSLNFTPQASPVDHLPQSNNGTVSQKPTGSKGFRKWFDHIKDSLVQENPQESDIVRLGIKQWRKMTTEEKQPWM